MKLISLNTWGGRVADPLKEFFHRNRDIDVFLLQEVFHNATDKTWWDEGDDPNLFSLIAGYLSGHTGYFNPVQDDEWGLAAFIRNHIRVDDVQEHFVHRHKDAMVGREGDTLGRSVQYVRIADGPVSLLNFHGLWTGKDKNDTEERIAQSRKLVEFAASVPGPKILAGDFNLLPETESVAIIEHAGFRNLIKEYAIPTTRTSWYTKPEKYADYVFVSNAIRVQDFQVVPEEVSDHAALYLEFTV